MKSIDDALGKSHQHLTIRNSKVRGVLDDFAHSTRNRKTEKGLFISSDGEVVLSKNGNKEGVDFTESEMKDAYEQYGVLHIEHNHPDVVKGVHSPYSECLSNADMDYLLSQTRFYDQHTGWGEYEYCFKSITAEGTNGSRMTLVRGDYYTEEDSGTFYDASTKLTKSYYDYQELYSKTHSELLHKIVPPGEYDESWSEKVHKETIKLIGEFEDTSEFKDVQSMFRSANCRLSVEWIDI